jgi:hypothetical protein
VSSRDPCRGTALEELPHRTARSNHGALSSCTCSTRKARCTAGWRRARVRRHCAARSTRRVGVGLIVGADALLVITIAGFGVSLPVILLAVVLAMFVLWDARAAPRHRRFA